MSLHRITAGSGYDYLTRQVAAMDSTERGHTGLASYYGEKGEVPGRWVGSGLAGVEGLDPGDLVTAEQMLALFGSGRHPLAAQRATELAADPNATEQDVLDAIRLGQPFKVYAHDISPFRVEVARRLEADNVSAGRPRKASAAIEERARVRSEVAAEWFRRDFGRAPLNQRELAGHLARLSRQQTTAVAGFDLTFSPVKSVSALWALADKPVAAAIERAHQAAVADALRFIEAHALFTRTGANGVRQVDVRGLIGAAFTHRDSRAGDPDLHTHVAVANKVQALDGKWLSIDSRVLHKAITAASETYNTRLEAHLTASLGVRFEARHSDDLRKRPVREIVGMDPALVKRWSARRQRIVTRQGELSAQFQARHGRPPTPVEAIALAQQATLETREAKHEPRTLDEQRATWRDQAEVVLGSPQAVQSMSHIALHPAAIDRPVVDRQWWENAAQRILARVEQDRSAWQIWHVRAEALRYTRGQNVPADSTDVVVDWLTGHVLGHYSIPLTPDTETVTEPEPLRRADGASVYTIAGNRLYTSTRILHAEQRLVTHAGHTDGRTVTDAVVDLALLDTAATGVELNAGQAALVRAMATSGSRLQLAIAPAGSGKTTAMQALARAWTDSGGDVIGLATSAVAAAGLGKQIDAHADTIAKLAWHLSNGGAPDWMRSIGPDTLVIIDEAGMADTLSFDAVVTHVIEAGGSVRLIGDDQQLAAIGAGGVLRDIQASHGALQLSELVRFSDPSEGSASLALREGEPEALGFYLDRDRIHIGSVNSMLDQLFDNWANDREAGRDSVMLAPTRELVAQLNERARSHRLAEDAPDVEVELADGNLASIGDVIITRRNDRSLRLNATDWVKNGDRWTIQTITRNAIRVCHTQTGRHISLPIGYVTEWVELGYATTTHSAQGVTADTCHGMLTGDENRQQAYTMLTRGRHTNTCYLNVVGDGDPHSLIRPEVIHPATAVDQLERILVRDESPLSATTTLRQAADPRVQLGDATGRYRDAIAFAADHNTSAADRHTIEVAAEHLLPGISKADAWPALFAQLLTINADNRDPIDALTRAASEPVVAGRDPAAILAYRLDDDSRPGRRGPLPWLRPIPASLTRSPTWGRYLAARATLVTDLAGRVRELAEQKQSRPAWIRDGLQPSTHLAADVEVWRAANQVPDTDHRPTGEPSTSASARRWQHQLDGRLTSLRSPALDEWGQLLQQLDPSLVHDPYLATLANRIAHVSSAGLDAAHLLRHAIGEGPLPDEHAAAALWWRISAHLTPAVTQYLDSDQHMAAQWLPRFREAVGQAQADSLQHSNWWPALVTTIEHALQRGWTLDALINHARGAGNKTTDDCQAWVWRLSLATQPIPDDNPEPDEYTPPDDLNDGWTPPDQPVDMVQDHPGTDDSAPTDQVIDDSEDEDPDAEAERILTIEAMVRTSMRPPGPSDAEIGRQQDCANAWHECPHTFERLAHINELTTQFYETRFPDSWAQPYLNGRLRHDLTGDPDVRPGYASDAWTRLVEHLRRLGVTDEEMLAAGVASTASTGRLIDRFRDRLVFPINHDGHILGFVARRNPTHDDDRHGPKYLNTADTVLFHKGDQLYIPMAHRDAIPVLVEGPLDAIAVTLATDRKYVGAAALGTSLTEAQATQLLAMSPAPILATDSDTAGKAAAIRDYWMLAAGAGQPRIVDLPESTDPAALLARDQAETLRSLIDQATPLARELLVNYLEDAPDQLLNAIRILASAPPALWHEGIQQVAETGSIPEALVRTTLAPLVRTWNQDPLRAARGSSATTRVPEHSREPMSRGEARNLHRTSTEVTRRAPSQTF
ncbi:MobF family relaxase [Micropruina sonneratiae]|uniref:MobF family relaxase n=1 Tax=Micropruina sonneratiae TaxID=2986940 RepID=UPI0022266062|nr:MobF family relaxase [Micropruina sp. KQZ13P-5]MCW3159458.1 relaxase domain-containing protein [Micropruina sp. KQZ13P-5]